MIVTSINGITYDETNTIIVESNLEKCKECEKNMVQCSPYIKKEIIRDGQKEDGLLALREYLRELIDEWESSTDGSTEKDIRSVLERFEFGSIE